MANIPSTDVTYQTPTTSPGRRGLRWDRALDLLQPDEAALCSNTIQQQDGSLGARVGQTSTVTGLGNAHSISRMNLPSTGTFMRFWGGNVTWFRGNTTGTLAVLEAAFSGNPLTLLPYRPTLSGDPWMIAADSAKMRQASSTSTSIQLGLPAPAAAITSAIASLLTTSIAAFDASDGTQAASWTMTAGVDRSTPPAAAGAPAAANVAGVSGNAVEFTTAVGAAVTGYSSIVSIAKAIDLSTLQGGATAATDQDLIHLWLRVNLPALVEEIRIYFVCSAAFTAGVVPGQSGTQNMDAFMKAIRPHDVTDFVEDLESALAANEAARQAALLTQFVENPPAPPIDESPIPTGGTLDPFIPFSSTGSADLPTQGTEQLAPGRNVWSELGVVNKPLRRGEFLRIGSSSGRGWNNITGIVIVIQTAVNSSVALACDDWFMYGGAGLDSTEPTASPYDWRATNYHLDTGDEGNPSPIQAQTAWLDVARAKVTLTPAAFGSARVRQKFYRRGGTAVTDWFYEGMNSSDGGTFTTDASDAEVVAAGTLQLDNDQPVTTVNSAGTTVLAQPLPSVFGPIGGRLFGVGDPNRPGTVYWSKVDRAGSWPPGNTRDACAPSEGLQMGAVLGGSVGIALSRERGYLVTTSEGGGVSVDESGCRVGIASRWAWVQGVQGLFFVSADQENPGIYLTNGQDARKLSGKIDPIFRGQTVVLVPPAVVTRLPIDWAQTTALRLGFEGHKLWFHYKDTGGTTRVLVCDLGRGVEDEEGLVWNEYTFSVPPQMSYAEPPQGDAPNFWLGASSGVAYLHTGTTDAGAAISCRLITGAQDFGRPRENKDLGDVILDADVVTGQTFTVTPYLDDGGTALAAAAITPTTGRRRYIVDPFGTTPSQARNVQLSVIWGASTSTSPSALYKLGTSFVLLPEIVQLRATEWELAGTLTDKSVKGVLLECDTFGAAKTIAVEADGATIATITVNHSGRRVSHFSFAVGIGRVLRLRPTNTAPVALYDVQWIFDEEPLQLARWETQRIDHGVHGWQTPFAAEICYKSSVIVDLVLSIYYEDGTLRVARAYELPSSSGAKVHRYVPFYADKGVLFHWLFTARDAATGFWLYREESRVLVLPLGAAEPNWVQPFGSDDLDRVRQMGNAAGSASTPNPRQNQPLDTGGRV